MAARARLPAACLRFAVGLPLPCYISETPASICRAAPSWHSRRYQPWTPTNRPPLGLHHHRKPPHDPDAPLRDEDIGAEIVQIVNTDGSLGQPLSLRAALISFDREQNFLVKVADRTADRFTVCRVVSKAEFREQQRSKGKPPKGSNALKQVELNWAIDQHDLSHRLNQMESFLNKGKRVQLTLVRKLKKRPATAAEAESLLETVKQWIKDTNAIETKPMKGKPPYHVEFFLEKPRNR